MTVVRVPGAHEDHAVSGQHGWKLPTGHDADGPAAPPGSATTFGSTSVVAQVYFSHGGVC